MESGSFLRGTEMVATNALADASSSSSSPSEFGLSVLRWLHDGSDSNANVTSDTHAASSGESNYQNNSFLMFASIVVGCIVLCYAYCMFQVVRFWLCRRHSDDETARAVLANQGIIFNLTTGQRRAVLEAIFSETSKAVTGDDVFKKKSKSMSDDGTELHTGVDALPKEISLNVTLDTSKSDSDDEEVLVVDVETGATIAPLTLNASQTSHDGESGPAATNSMHTSDSLFMESTGASAANPSLGVSTTSAHPKLHNIRRSFPWRHNSSAESDVLSPVDDLRIPALGEECKQEEKDSLPLTLLPHAPVAAAMAASNTYDDDDETDDNLCAICLSSYQEGEVLIASKYCSHLFHKDCILEWLDKHDVCPCCRVDMVTEGEINKAATSLVGKQRMYKAVGSMAAVSTSPPASPTNRNRMSPRGRPGVSPRVRRVGGATR